MRFIALLIWIVPSAIGQTGVAELLERETLARIRAYDEAREGVLGVAAIDLASGRTIEYNAQTVFPAASTIKVPVMIELYRRGARLDETVSLAPAELVEGSERLRLLLKRGPARATVRELIEAMIEVSDNTAANKLIELAGTENVNRMLDELKLPATRLRRKMMDSVAAARDQENVSTPLELARIAELLYRNQPAGEKASAEMLAAMRRVEGGIRRAVPARIDVAAKTGELPGARCELGLVFRAKRPYALGIMSAYIRDSDDPTPAVAALIDGYFEKLAQANRYGRRLE